MFTYTKSAEENINETQIEKYPSANSHTAIAAQ